MSRLQQIECYRGEQLTATISVCAGYVKRNGEDVFAQANVAQVTYENTPELAAIQLKETDNLVEQSKQADWLFSKIVWPMTHCVFIVDGEPIRAECSAMKFGGIYCLFEFEGKAK